MKKRRASGIIFHDNKGYVLLQDRKEIKKWGEEYGLFGGAIEEGETWEEALKREIKEELGIELEDYKLFEHEFIDYPEHNLSVEFYVSLAKMPDTSKFKVTEGKPIILKIKDALNLNMLSGDIKTLKKLYDYLKKSNSTI